MNDELLNTETEHKSTIPGKKSTIVSGVFIAIGFISLIVAYLVNFKEVIAHMTSQADNAGEAIGVVVAAIVVAALLIFAIILCLALPFALGIPALVLSIKNIKRENETIRKCGIAFTIISSVMLIAVVGRLVLLFTGIM